MTIAAETMDPRTRDRVDAYIEGLSYDPKTLLAVKEGVDVSIPVEKGEPSPDKPTRREAVPGAVVLTKYTHVTLLSNLSELALLSPITGVVYPGALVIADSDLADGKPKALSAPRGPMTISLNVPNFAKSTSRVVEDPSNSSVQDAVNSLTKDWLDQHQEQPAKSFERQETAYDSRQVALKLGFSAKWASGDVAAQLNVARESETSTAIAMYKQLFFTVTMDTPARPSDVFGPGVDAKWLARHHVDATRPPAYVRSVDWGRLVMIKMETSKASTSVDMETALKQVAAGTKFGVDVDLKYKELIEAATFSVLVIGGSSVLASTRLNGKDALANLGSYIREGAVFTPDNMGLPIAYTVAFLKDNALATMGFATDYTKAESVVYPDHFITVWNDSGMVGKFNVSWEERAWKDLDDPDRDTWTPREWGSGRLTNPDRAESPIIPGSARNVRVRVTFLDLVWDGWFPAFRWRNAGERLVTPPYDKRYALKGTTHDASISTF